jgi:hypothetical protein
MRPTRVAVVLITVAAALVRPSSAAAAPASFASPIAIGTICAGVPSGAPTAALQLTQSQCTFTNPLSRHGPDPWLTYYNSNSDGTPNLATPVALGAQLPVPSGEPAS